LLVRFYIIYGVKLQKFFDFHKNLSKFFSTPVQPASAIFKYQFFI